MKKIFLLVICFVLSLNLIGQLNPIKNLTYHQWYEFDGNCPHSNCFELFWDEPDTSMLDTLKGYNIYKNNSLWIFQDFCDISCSGFVPCGYPDFYNDNFSPFWIKIKAVYNSSLEESIADDSIQVNHLAIKIIIIE